MHTQLTPRDLIVVLKTALQAFREKVSDDVSALYIQTLTTAVVDPGIWQADMSRALGDVSSTAAARNIVNLGRRRKDGKAGPDFLVQRPHPTIPKRKVIDPTDKALKWLEALAIRSQHRTRVQLDAVKLAALLRESMSLIRTATDTDVAVYRMLILLTALEKPGLSQAELGEATDILTQAAVSRNVLNLTAYKADKSPGPDFLEQRLDPLQRQEQRVYPTVKAQQWFENVVERVNAKLLIFGVK